MGTSLFTELHFRYPFRRYQQMILEIVARQEGDRKFHIVALPGSGKTIVGLELIRRFGRLAVLREGLCVPIIGGDLDLIHLDDEMVRLQELRETIGIGDIVTFLGAKDQGQLPYCYSAAEILPGVAG